MAAINCAQCSKKLGFLESPVVVGDARYCADCGSRVQIAKRHELEAAIQVVIVSTTPGLEGFAVQQYLGTVSSFSLLKLDMVQEWFADIEDWWGGKSSGYAKKFADLQSDAEAKLKFQAVAKGGNAVIGAAFHVEFIETNTGEKKMLSNAEIINRKLLVSGSGTAVKVRRIA